MKSEFFKFELLQQIFEHIVAQENDSGAQRTKIFVPKRQFLQFIWQKNVAYTYLSE